MPTVLLTLGRLPKALDLARSFHAAGWRVVVAEPHRRHLVGASRSVAKHVPVTAPVVDKAGYLRDLARIAAEEQATLILPVSEEILHVAALRHLIGPEKRILAMPQPLIERVHDKAGFVEIALDAGLTVPPSHPLGTSEAAALAAAHPVVVKLRHSCSGRGLRRLAQGTPLPLPNAPSLVQQMVEGEEFSTCSLAHLGHIQGTATYRATLLSGSVAVGFERVTHPAIEAWVARFVAATDWSGFIAFDFIVDRAGTPWGIECNPRTTSGLHFFKTEDIAMAILDAGRPLCFRPEARLQQFWSVMTALSNAIGDWRRYRDVLHHLLTTPDVTWRLSDPLPLLTMPWTAWPILSAARRTNQTFGEVAMLDFAFNAKGAAPLTAA
jgi:ATP-grasp domain